MHGSLLVLLDAAPLESFCRGATFIPGWAQFLAFVQVLEFYGLEKQNKWAQLGYESLFFAGFTFLAWAVGVPIMSPS